MNSTGKLVNKEMSEYSEKTREWVGLILGLIGTVTGSVSLYFVWSQNAQLQENLSISINPVRSGYPSLIQTEHQVHLRAGTIETRWRVWAVNLSARETTLTGSAITLMSEKGKFGYSGLFQAWEVEGEAIFPFPKRLEPGEVFNATLVLNYPVTTSALTYALGDSGDEEIAVNDIGSFTRQLIVDTGKDILTTQLL
ncbi:MAG: hypothetical protein P1U69_13855 [Parvibaculaceae bacterium]|nr:hypothetical protein [Parvibaculaceae bacterium]|tara:strand:+ start:3202 stop:3789 length:588 start_codon:yes stop_codon:yes gene_type:complete